MRTTDPPGPEARWPPVLRRGDMVAAVAPAGPPNRTFVEQGRALLREWGLESRLMPNVFAGHTRGFLAAEDDARAGDLQDAFADPRLAGVVCLRGGYGSQRLLDRLDFEAIAANPKAFVGFSDVTALHVALSQRAGLITYHGPNLGGDPRRFTPAGRASMRALLFGRPGATLHGERLRPGRARAQLVGGNLTLLSTLCGTPDSLDARGRILLIEEVGEAPYRIDRALTHLRRAGVLEELAGLAVASFWRCEGPYGAEIGREVVAEHAGALGVPAVADLPLGHGPGQWTVALDATAVLDGDAGTVQLIDGRSP